MRRRISIIIVLALIISSIFCVAPRDMASVKAEPIIQVLGSLDAKVTASFLNVRQGPSLNHKVICVLKRGQVVKVFAKIGDWYALYEPSMGCVGLSHGNYLDVSWPKPDPAPTSQPEPTPKPPAPEPEPEPEPTPEPTPEPAPEPEPEPTPEPGPPEDISQDEQALLDLVNRARSDAGVGPLKFDAELMRIARIKAKEMVDKNYFSHDSPTYGSPIDMMKQFGISFRTAGENIAGNRTVQGAFNAWMNSEGHRRNILNGKFNYTGIGIVDSPTYGKILVQMFIGR